MNSVLIAFMIDEVEMLAPDCICYLPQGACLRVQVKLVETSVMVGYAGAGAGAAPCGQVLDVGESCRGSFSRKLPSCAFVLWSVYSGNVCYPFCKRLHVHILRLSFIKLGCIL